MPTDETILGFSNPWYPEAIRSSTTVSLGPEFSIRLISAPAFVATKLEAFISRGKRDIFSHDLEDVLVVVDGRPELIEELATSARELRDFVGRELAGLLNDDGFLNTLPGLLADGERSAIVSQRLNTLARQK